MLNLVPKGNTRTELGPTPGYNREGLNTAPQDISLTLEIAFYLGSHGGAAAMKKELFVERREIEKD